MEAAPPAAVAPVADELDGNAVAQASEPVEAPDSVPFETLFEEAPVEDQPGAADDGGREEAPAEEAAGPSDAHLPDFTDLPSPVFADEIDATLPVAGIENDEPAGEAADVSDVAFDGSPADTVEAAAGEAVEPLPAASEAPVDAGPRSLQDMLRQLEGQFGGFAAAEDEEQFGGAAAPVGESDVEAPAEPESSQAPAVAEQSSDDTDGAEDLPGAEELSAILGSLGARFDAGNGGDATADEVGSSAQADDRDAGTDFPGNAMLAPDEASGETARMLLDIMSMPSGSLQPQERGLAADTLLRLIARMPIKAVMALAERFCLMDEPPGLIIKELIAHANEEVAALVLERCANVTDQDLLELIAQGNLNKLLMVARRRQVSSALVDALISHGDASVYLTIVRNPGADISYDAFVELCELAKSQPSLQAPLATRANTPAPIAFELFWFLPTELRRYVLSRFLTDSETLTKILKITLAVDTSAANDVAERTFPSRARIEELIGLIEEGLTPEASRLMANLSGICEACARRLIADPDGEPLTIVMKAMGATRALFAAAMERWQTSTSAMLRSDRNLDELRNLFDSLSFNKARVLLTYWDWAARKAGPYARRAA